MTMIFIARWYPRPESRADFLAIVGRLSAGFTPDIAAGVAALQPTFNREGQFVAIEIWKDENALNTLRASKLFHDAIRDMSACCSRPLEIEHLDAPDGDGGIFKRYPPGKANPKFYPDLGPMTPLFC